MDEGRRARGQEGGTKGSAKVQRWCDGVAGDTLARGHVDKGNTRVSSMEY